MEFTQPLSRTSHVRAQLTSTPVNLPWDDEAETKQDGLQCMETLDSEAEAPDFPCEDDFLEESTRWNNTHAFCLITVPPPSFRQKTVYSYPACLDLAKISFQ
jgi:hypothetical protein